MKLIFVGGVFSKEKEAEFLDNTTKGIVQFAANDLQWAYINGILKFAKYDLTVLNLPFVGPYPIAYKKRYFRNEKFIHKNKVLGFNIYFDNYRFINLLSRYKNLKKNLYKTINRDEKYVVIIYSMHLPFIKAVVDLKKKNPNIQICLIVPDLPQFISDKRTLRFKFYQAINKFYLKKLLLEIDFFIVISSFMPEKIIHSRKSKFLVIEGILNDDNLITETSTYKSIDKNIKRIVYTGTLDKRYGILNLIHAFVEIPFEHYELIICGNGDSKETIKKIQDQDKRIKYFGQLGKDQIKEIQKSANLLVNPRTNESEFTKYSFPSKTIEYFASGVPVLLYKLDGIPAEYFKYCFTIENDNSILHLKNSIINICEKDPAILNEIGAKAKRFILQKKNKTYQCQKLLNFIGYSNLI